MGGITCHTKAGARSGSVVARERISAKNTYVLWIYECVTCGAEFRARPSIIHRKITRGSTGCAVCDLRIRKHRQETARAAHALKRAASKQETKARARAKLDEIRGIHEPGAMRGLTAIGPVEPGVVPWEVPFYRVRSLYRYTRRYGYDEDDPGFENSVRVLEDYSAEDPA